MDMNGTQRIEAAREKVYTALNDTEVLRQCVPGCETIEKLSDTQMRATVTLKVGPVKASFKGMITLSDLDPPNGYKITGEGSGGPAGFAKGGADVQANGRWQCDHSELYGKGRCRRQAGSTWRPAD